MKIIEDNKCELHCECGWNITIGGTDKKEYEILKHMFEDKQPSSWTSDTSSTDFSTYNEACVDGKCTNAI